MIYAMLVFVTTIVLYLSIYMCVYIYIRVVEMEYDI